MSGAPLRITLLGGFTVHRDGEAVPERAWRLRKARSLVKLLALAPDHRLHRDVVTEALWPDRDPGAAANNLHQALHAARRALGDAQAVTLADGVLALEPGAEVDVVALDRVAAGALASGDAAALRDAVARYGAEPLPEDRYEPWAQPAREAVQARYLELSVRAPDATVPAGAPAPAPRAPRRAPAGRPP